MAKKNPTLAEDQGRCIDAAVCISSGANQTQIVNSVRVPLPPAYSLYLTIPSFGMYRDKGKAWGEKLINGIEAAPGAQLVGITHNDRYSDRYQFCFSATTKMNPWPELEQRVMQIFEAVAPTIMPEQSYEKWHTELLKCTPSQSRSEVAKELLAKVKKAKEAVARWKSGADKSAINAAQEAIDAVEYSNIWKLSTLKDRAIDALPSNVAQVVRDAQKTMKEYSTDMMKLTEVWTARAFLPFAAPFAVSFVRGSGYGGQQQAIPDDPEAYLDMLRKKAFSEMFSKECIGLARNAVLSTKHFPMTPFRTNNAAPSAYGTAKELRIFMGWPQCRLHKLLVDELIAQLSGTSKSPLPEVAGLFKAAPVAVDGRKPSKDGVRSGSMVNDPYGMEKLYSISVSGIPAGDPEQTEAKARYLLSKLFGRVYVYDWKSGEGLYMTSEAASLPLSPEDRDKLDKAAETMLDSVNIIGAERERVREERQKATHVLNRVVPLARGSKLFVQIAGPDIPPAVMTAVDSLKQKYPDSFGEATVVPTKGGLYCSVYINAPASSEAVGFSHKMNAAEYLTAEINKNLGEEKFKTACPDDGIGIEAVIRGTDEKRLCVKYPLVAKEGGVVESILEGMDEPEEHPGYEVNDPVSKALWAFHSSFGKTARQIRKYEKDPEKKEFLKKFEPLEKFIPAKSQLEKHTNTVAYVLPQDQKEAEKEISVIKGLLEEKLRYIEESDPDNTAFIESWLDYKWMPDTTAKYMKEVNDDIRKYGAGICTMLMEAADNNEVSDASIEEDLPEALSIEY